MKRLRLALCLPPPIRKARLWPTRQRSAALLAASVTNIPIQTNIVRCRRRGGNSSLLFRSQGGLRNSKHEFTLSSQEYVHELRSGITEEKLFHCLESLRVSLTSNPVRFVLPASFTLHNLLPHVGESVTHSRKRNQSHHLTAERGV